MTPSELIHSSSTLSSESFVDEDDESEENYGMEDERNYREEGNTSFDTGKGKEKTTAKNNGDSGVGIFSCLSRKGFIIGLPKVPDTRFRSRDFAARIRCKISGKGCKRPSFSFIPKEAMGTSSASINKGGGNNSFKTYEPGSPDVSCIGRIKLKQKDVKKLKTLTSLRREDRQSRKTERKRKPSWFKKLFNLGRTKVESAAALPESRGGPSDNPHNVRDIVQEENSCASVPRLSDLKRFASQREPAALSNLFFEDTDAREQQQPAAESGDNQSGRVMESNFSEESEISKKFKIHDSKPAKEEGLKKEMAEISVDSNCSLLDTDGIGGSTLTPPCEINLWKRRSVAAPRALQLTPNRYGLDMRKPLTV